jgi:hypothetical protein
MVYTGITVGVEIGSGIPDLGVIAAGLIVAGAPLGTMLGVPPVGAGVIGAMYRGPAVVGATVGYVTGYMPDVTWGL